MHSLLQRWAEGELETYELLSEFENGYEDNVPEKFPKLRNGKSMEDGYYDDAIQFLSGFDGIGSYKIISVEEHFEIQIEDFIFNGYIDLLLEDEDGNLIVWDWKSKKEFEDEEEEAKYRRQLYLYSYYVEEKYGKYPQKTTFYCFRKQTEYTREFDENAYNNAIKWMFDTVRKIRELYSAYNWFKCNNICGFGVCKGICPIKREVEGNPHWKTIIKNLKKEG